MKFNLITLKNKNILVPYLQAYGSDSCQHSFAQMVGLNAKYGDEYCIENDVLYIHRSRLDTDDKRVYLAPLGFKETQLFSCINVLLEDCASYNKKLSFETVTADFADSLQDAFPDRFIYSNERDLAEYIYTTESLATLSGSKLDGKRNHINTFMNKYPNAIIEKIDVHNIEDAKAFQLNWLAERNSYEADSRLNIENDSISIYLNNYSAFDFDGIIVYIDGNVAGFAAGVPLSNQCMDEIIEKGNRAYTGIYQVLCREFADKCCKSYTYINREEDIGIPGLRKAKESYHPFKLLEKYIVTEK